MPGEEFKKLGRDLLAMQMRAIEAEKALEGAERSDAFHKADAAEAYERAYKAEQQLAQAREELRLALAQRQDYRAALTQARADLEAWPVKWAHTIDDYSQLLGETRAEIAQARTLLVEARPFAILLRDSWGLESPQRHAMVAAWIQKSGAFLDEHKEE